MTRVRLATVFASAMIAGQAGADELVQLQNGFSLVAKAHADRGDAVIFSSGNGELEIAKSAVRSIDIIAPEGSTAIPPTAATPEQIVSKAGATAGLPESLVLSVAQHESGFRPNVRSVKGARGLMQLMPRTAAELGVDPAQPEANAAGGARYLRQLLIQYHGDAALALAAYNAGPGRVQRAAGVPAIRETRLYVKRVLEEYARREKASASLARSDAGTQNGSRTKVSSAIN